VTPRLATGLTALGLLALAASAWLVWPRGTTDTTRACGLDPARIGQFVDVPGGSFIKNANGLYPEEGSPLRLHVTPFRIQVNEVTNDEFAAFVRATGYVTEAERRGGSALFVETPTPWDDLSWWRLDAATTWRSPIGAGSDLAGKGRLPVVHVTLNDARAYADWAGARLPSEVEWEYAASLGLTDPDDPLSGAFGLNGAPRANVWNGLFPVINTMEDGFRGPAPVGCYAASRIGTHDMIGNVWEWTETGYGDGQPQFTIKGGSYLCSDSYCRRFRAAARQGQDADFSTAHIGIRLVRDVD
jgi:sulfatase modifying factor 1